MQFLGKRHADLLTITDTCSSMMSLEVISIL